jgi:hypothetical protein
MKAYPVLIAGGLGMFGLGWLMEVTAGGGDFAAVLLSSACILVGPVVFVAGMVLALFRRPTAAQMASGQHIRPAGCLMFAGVVGGLGFFVVWAGSWGWVPKELGIALGVLVGLLPYLLAIPSVHDAFFYTKARRAEASQEEPSIARESRDADGAVRHGAEEGGSPLKPEPPTTGVPLRPTLLIKDIRSVGLLAWIALAFGALAVLVAILAPAVIRQVWAGDPAARRMSGQLLILGIISVFFAAGSWLMLGYYLIGRELRWLLLGRRLTFGKLLGSDIHDWDEVKSVKITHTPRDPRIPGIDRTLVIELTNGRCAELLVSRESESQAVQFFAQKGIAVAPAQT